MTEPDGNLLTARDLHKKLDRTDALNGASLSVARGEVLAACSSRSNKLLAAGAR